MEANSKICFAILTAFIVTLYIFTTPELINQLRRFHEPKRTRYILYWTKMFQAANYSLGFGEEIFKNCPVSNCFATNDRKLMAVEDFDAVLFHGRESKESLSKIPERRRPEQKYVYVILESPIFTPTSIKFEKNFFNWTMTYRDDSDIIWKYGKIIPNKTGYRVPSVEEIGKRTKKIIWFVSRCRAPSKREMLAEKISNYMKIDIYGKCGNLTCTRNMADECYDMMERDYKFYLSFENSFCEEYVTEKLFNVLQKNIVPIVYGGADYSKIVPPHSVIDVSKFETVKELADYLNYLDANPKEYLKYFEWKKSFSSNTGFQHTLCQMCQKLNEPTKTIFKEDVVQWWHYPEVCKSGEELPYIVFS